MNPHPRRPLAVIALLLSLCAWPTDAQAQAAYKCMRDGRVYYSDRPCEIDAKPVLTSPQDLSGQLPEHWRFLGRNCRQLAEDLHRLRRRDRQNGNEDADEARTYALQQRFESQCWNEEERARRQLVDSARDESERQRALRQQAQTLLDSCLEMRRIRDLRRPTAASLPAGEKADFERFEANFSRRCSGVLTR